MHFWITIKKSFDYNFFFSQIWNFQSIFWAKEKRKKNPSVKKSKWFVFFPFSDFKMPIVKTKFLYSFLPYSEFVTLFKRFLHIVCCVVLCCAMFHSNKERSSLSQRLCTESDWLIPYKSNFQNVLCFLFWYLGFIICTYAHKLMILIMEQTMDPANTRNSKKMWKEKRFH